MRGVRSNARFGSWLALFALALQLALSFGHVHLNAHFSRAAPWFAASLKMPAPGSIPEKPAKHTKFTDFCAICAVVHMASASLVATTPSDLLPNLVSHERMPLGFHVRLIALLRLPAQARAPPAA
jgi:hypothetical protein